MFSCSFKMSAAEEAVFNVRCKMSANIPKKTPQQSSLLCFSRDVEQLIASKRHCGLFTEEVLSGQCSLNALCHRFPHDRSRLKEGFKPHTKLTEDWCYHYFSRHVCLMMRTLFVLFTCCIVAYGLSGRKEFLRVSRVAAITL